jgi:hypothetical protein
MTFAVLVLVSSQALASGSLDYFCAQEKGNVRYSYHEGEEIDASLFVAKGVDAKKAFDEIVTGDQLSLDAFSVARILIRDHEINFSGCFEDDKDCEKNTKNVTKFDDKLTKESDKLFKFNRMVHTATRKDGTSVTLNIRNYSEDTDGEFFGTLTVKANDSTYRGIQSVKVNCIVSTP